MSKQDVLRYLGHEGQVIDQKLMHDVDYYYDWVCRLPGKYVYQIFDLSRDPLKVDGTIISLRGQSIENILSQSKQVILFAATLGIEVDRKLQQLKYTSGTHMMILNACASARIEEVVDDITKKILDKKNGYLTPRFSPGYGDLDLSHQREIIKVLETEKRIGLTCNASALLMPVKSVTGIIGFSDEEMSVKYNVCDDCLQRTVCDFKICKRGV